MKNLQQTLKNHINKQHIAWKNYTKCFITQVNRLLEYMGENKDFTINDLEEAMQENFYNNYNCKILTKKALACNIVEKYSFVQFCYRHWLKTVKELIDIEAKIAYSFIE